MTVQLQQKASEVDSKKVSAAISRLLKSWQASDEEDAAADAASIGKQKQQRRPDQPEQAEPSADVRSNGSAQATPPAQEQQPEQEAKRNRLLALFGRGKNQQTPEELLPLRVSASVHALQLLTLRHIAYQQLLSQQTTLAISNHPPNTHEAIAVGRMCCTWP